MVRLANPSAESFRGFGSAIALAASVVVAAGCSAADNKASESPLGNAGYGGGVVVPAGSCPAQIFQQCKTCHDGMGTAGTVMGLMTYEDFKKPSHSNASIPVYKMVQNRLHPSTARVMPPSGWLPDSDLAVVDSWVNLGAPDCAGFQHVAPPPGSSGGAPPTGQGGAGNVGVGAGGTTVVPPGYGGTPIGAGGTFVGGGGTAPVGGAAGAGGSGMPPPDVSQYLSPDGTYFIKEPPFDKPVGPDAPDAEFCFNLVAHNAQTPLPSDNTPFQVAASEFYHEFDYKVPYTKPMVALSTKPIINNAKVLHHWLLFHTVSDTGNDGSHVNEIGLQIGKELVSGWAPGGNPPILPAGVGMEFPKPGGFLALEFHYFNNTGAVAQDRSGVRLCMTSKIPDKVATVTWLGTEAINIPANGQGTAVGTCTPAGGAQKEDIHLIFVSPHMHQAGTHMKTVINRKGGGTEIVVDKPFAFTDQREYEATNVIHPGDTLTTTCTWQNTTGRAIGFGTSTTAEMCYDFAFAYPAHAMPNPNGGGIEGSSNMCLR